MSKLKEFEWEFLPHLAYSSGFTLSMICNHILLVKTLTKALKKDIGLGRKIFSGEIQKSIKTYKYLFFLLY